MVMPRPKLLMTRSSNSGTLILRHLYPLENNHYVLVRPSMLITSLVNLIMILFAVLRPKRTRTTTITIVESANTSVLPGVS